MSVMTLWASVINQVIFTTQKDFLLMLINAAVILIVLWIVVEGLIKFFQSEKTEVRTKPSAV